jgi:adapter protein MecA 1/2
MKIEKINDNQIRCTLTNEDLESRKIRLSELAYGSAKAKLLFQDMMQQAHNRFGFDTGNSPLMIEAIPLSPESIVLIITKVDDPQELDARFSKFSPADSDSDHENNKHFSGADDILDLFTKIQERRKHAEDSDTTETDDAEKVPSPVSLIQAFRFPTLEHAILAAKSLDGFYTGQNSLVKNSRYETYDLILHQSGMSPADFNKVCNIMTEYGAGQPFSSSAEAYVLEHEDVIIRRKALQTLAQL